MTKRQAKRSLKAAIERAIDGARDVDVAGHTNVVVSHNIDGSGSSHRATATQSTRIVQNGTERVDESVSTSSDGGESDG